MASIIAFRKCLLVPLILHGCLAYAQHPLQSDVGLTLGGVSTLTDYRGGGQSIGITGQCWKDRLGVSLYFGRQKLKSGLPEKIVDPLSTSIVDASYTYSTKIHDIRLHLNSAFVSRNRWAMSLSLGGGLSHIKSKGFFNDPSEARAYYSGWGDKVFKPIYGNGRIIDARINHSQWDWCFSPSITFQTAHINLAFTYALYSSSTLDAYNLPVWEAKIRESLLSLNLTIKAFSLIQTIKTLKKE